MGFAFVWRQFNAHVSCFRARVCGRCGFDTAHSSPGTSGQSARAFERRRSAWRGREVDPGEQQATACAWSACTCAWNRPAFIRDATNNTHTDTSPSHLRPPSDINVQHIYIHSPRVALMRTPGVRTLLLRIPTGSTRPGALQKSQGSSRSNSRNLSASSTR